MTAPLPLELGGRADRLYIHFDVKDHYLSLDTFIQTAESARNVVEALDKTFFSGMLRYEFIVLPPEDGTFLSKLAIVLAGGATTVGAIFAFVSSEVGSAYIEGLTGKPPTAWAKEIGEDHREAISEALASDESLGPPETDEGAISHVQTVPDTSTGELTCEHGAGLIAAMTRGILELGNDALLRIGMEVGHLPEALEARAEFYAACIEDNDVKRVGFTPDADFPIPRNSFPERAQKPARKKGEEEEPQWIVSVEGIFVTSPNWDQEDQRTRQWKGKDAVRRDCYFVIDDAEFWFRVKRKGLHVEVLDSLKVQWAYQLVDGRPKNRRVLRVLEFNGEKLAEPLSSDAIKAMVGANPNADAVKDGSSLFDYDPKRSGA